MRRILAGVLAFAVGLVLPAVHAVAVGTPLPTIAAIYGYGATANGFSPTTSHAVAVASATTPTDDQVVGATGDLSRRSIAFVAAETASSGLTFSGKITGQLAERGWTEESAAATVKNPSATHSVWDYTTGDKLPATAYVQRGGGYVVTNDETGAVVQISDLNKANWKPVWEDPRFQR